MKTYQNQTFDEERALYGLHGARVHNCRFEGPADGESALKECQNVDISDCHFLLRYPLWHVHGAKLSNSAMTDTCRAALWYDDDVTIDNCTLGGIKALRECRNVRISGGEAVSTEFGWMCQNVVINNFTLSSEYPFLNARDMDISNLTMKGKYSFQYVKNTTIRDSVLDTKDAFWHSENVTVVDSVIKGEYLAWYAKNLRLVRCTIIGTQPLCYCEGLVLENCVMQGTDLSFENSDVNATVLGDILSVKNPLSGSIVADSIGEVILDEHIRPGACCKIEQHTAHAGVA